MRALPTNAPTTSSVHSPSTMTTTVGTGEDRIRKLFEACGDMIAVRGGA